MMIPTSMSGESHIINITRLRNLTTTITSQLCTILHGLLVRCVLCFACRYTDEASHPLLLPRQGRRQCADNELTRSQLERLLISTFLSTSFNIIDMIEFHCGISSHRASKDSRGCLSICTKKAIVMCGD